MSAIRQSLATAFYCKYISRLLKFDSRRRFANILGVVEPLPIHRKSIAERFERSFFSQHILQREFQQPVRQGREKSHSEIEPG